MDATSIDEILYPLLGGCAVLCLASAILAIPGTILGLRRELIVYDGRGDLHGSWFVVAAVLASFVFLSVYPWAGRGFLLLSVVLFLVSIRRTFTANRSLGKSLLAIPTKFTLLVLLMVCGLLSFCLITGLQLIQQKKNKEGAKQLALGATGVIGFQFLKESIGKLVRETHT